MSINLLVKYYSRIFIGPGSACAYVGCLKVDAYNFSNSSRGVFMGLTLTIGPLESLFASKSLVNLIEYRNWHYAF